MIDKIYAAYAFYSRGIIKGRMRSFHHGRERKLIRRTENAMPSGPGFDEEVTGPFFRRGPGMTSACMEKRIRNRFSDGGLIREIRD